MRTLTGALKRTFVKVCQPINIPAVIGRKCAAKAPINPNGDFTMKKLALIAALMFAATGVSFAADAPAGATAEPTKSEAKAKPAKKAGKKAAKKAEAAKSEADKK